MLKLSTYDENLKGCLISLLRLYLFLIGNVHVVIWPPRYDGDGSEAKKSATCPAFMSWRETWVGCRKAKDPGIRPGVLSLPPDRCVTPVNTRLMDGMQIKTHTHTVKHAAGKQAPKQSLHPAKHRLTLLPKVHRTRDLPIMRTSCPPFVQILRKTKHLTTPFHPHLEQPEAPGS